MGIEVQNPEPPVVPTWSNMVQLSKEKEVVGIYISAHPLDDFKTELEHFARGDMRYMKQLTEIVNADLSLAGMVTSVEHRMTKTNKPFGSFEFEDYFDVHKFFLFSEDYLRMKHFLVPGSFLFVKGKVQARQWSKTGELEFKINSMELLSDLREKLTKKVILELRLDDLNDALLSNLESLISNKKPGPTYPVEFRIVDPMRKLSIRMPSRSMKIDLSNETINDLNAIRDVKYKLNA